MNPKEALNLPSLFIIIVAALGALYAVYGLFSNTQIPPEMLEDEKFREFLPFIKMAASAGKVGSLIALAAYGFTIFGALKMRNLESYGLSMAASIIVMVPCTCCCLFGLPVGIWSLVLLSKPEIKTAFK
jgi:hypothetical protein